MDLFIHILGVAANEIPYPEENKPKGAGKKWFTKVYKEFVEHTIEYKNLIMVDTKSAIINKDKSEDKW